MAIEQLHERHDAKQILRRISGKISGQGKRAASSQQVIQPDRLFSAASGNRIFA